jgi:6,7-dimethyl-8-ribityllumazine synthase
VLKPVTTRRAPRAGGHFAIVASRYNARYVDALVRAAQAELRRAKAESLRIVRVPGAFEIPVVAARLANASGSPLSAIICLGVIVRGETVHAQLIGEAVSHALARLQMESGIPVIHGVLLLENVGQAKRRCLDPKHNRGTEAALTALAMAQVMATLA